MTPAAVLAVFLFFAGLCSLFSGAHPAEAAYGQKIIAPEREDTPQNPDWKLGPAIDDLQRAIKKMVGQDFTVTRANAGFAGDGIFLVGTGSPDVPADTAAKLKGQGREAFAIKSVDDKTLWIVANGEEGISHGIYYYLEKLDCHWFLPGDDWEVIPKRESIALKMDEMVTPAFKIRDYFGTGGYGPESVYDPKYDRDGRLQFRIRTEDWKRRNRFGGEYTLDGHAGEAFNLAHKDVLTQHPEYLAEVNGKREWSITAKLDASNDDAVKLWVEDRLANYRAKRKTSEGMPYAFAVSVDPADGGGFCECEKCRAKFDAPNDATYYSNQVFYMANEVAKAVRKEFPDGYVNLYGYADHSAPPTIDLEPNVYVSVIPYGFNYSGLQPDDFIRQWGKKAARIGLYDYWSIPDWSWDQPTFNYLDTARSKIRFWHDNNVEGFTSESTFSAGAMGVGWYLASHLLWNPDANQDAILASFYKDSFGPAAPPMKRMMERWAKRFLLSSLELGQAYHDLQEAQKLAGNDTAIQARIDDYAKYVHFLRLYYEWLNAKGPEAKGEASSRLIEHLFDIYDTNMVHSFRLYQFLVDYGRQEKLYAEFDQHNADAPGWKRVAPLSHDDVKKLIADGATKFPPLDLELKTFSGKLVELQPNRPLPQTAKPYTWGTRMATRAGMDVEVEIPAGITKLPLNICRYYTNDIAVVDDKGEEISTYHIDGIKDYQAGEVFEATIPKPGHYVIKFRPEVGGGFWFQTLPGLTITLHTFLSEMGAPSPRLYFYVPRGLKKVVMWYPNGEINMAGAPTFRDADDENITPEMFDGGRLLILDVPVGQDGKVWSLEGSRSPDSPHRMLNTPETFAFSPETLMVPEDALK